MLKQRFRNKGDTACIFVHAGAGYHSRENEAQHLAACNDACNAGMAVMKAGGSSIDAVEIAIKVLEDREITNAGYGSNLGFDGIVECDAIIVDQFGRSGAAGAVAQIKNPISLARLLLDHSTQTLSLRRVPPNLLVSQGAAEFAHKHGQPIVPYDLLISPFARHRWQKWRADLAKAERQAERSGKKGVSISPGASEVNVNRFYDEHAEYEKTRDDFTKGLLAAVRNDAQPISPPPSYTPRKDSNPPSRQSSSSWSFAEGNGYGLATPEQQPHEYIDPRGPPTAQQDMAHHPFANSTQQVPTLAPSGRKSSRAPINGGSQEEGREPSGLDELTHDGIELPAMYSGLASRPFPYDDQDDLAPSTTDTPSASSLTGRSPSLATIKPQSEYGSHVSHRSPQGRRSPSSPSPKLSGQDEIMDTVGCIAIDQWGNIACGASSGGISMKHRGRVGPAALVGVGATVMPVDEDDEDETAVATVTSGTGEHMSTTMASSVCSERIRHSVRKVRGGALQDCMEEEAIRGFIEKDFMGHPSVKTSDSSGAIGMLSVKKTKDGVYLYFGHNTDSFALASLRSDEALAKCTMSRSHGNGSIAQGGRAFRFSKKR